jgi:hypothetical protein
MVVGALDLAGEDESFRAGDFEQAAARRTAASKEEIKKRGREVMQFP